MKLKEIKPKDQLVGEFVNRYQYFEIPEQSLMKTLPNGKVDIYNIIEGSFEIFDSAKNEFITVPRIGILPATTRTSLLRLSPDFSCLNIKFNLNILSIEAVRKLYNPNTLVSAKGLFSKRFMEIIQSTSFLSKNQLTADLLDDHLILEFDLDYSTEDGVSKKIIECFQTLDHFSVEKLADLMNVSSRTLGRITKRNYGFSPVELWNVMRFDQTTAHLKECNAQKFIEALDFGYYDQSHFIKECKKYAGHIPKEVFARMDLPTNDLMIYKDFKEQ